MFLARCCHADVKHCVPVETRSWVKHKNKRTCLNLQLRTGCEVRVSQYQPEMFDSLCFCLSRPAPPSSLTSTDPPRLLEDTSLQQTYWLSGKVHIAPGVSALHVYFPAPLLLYNHCTNKKKRADTQVLFHFPTSAETSPSLLTSG